MVPSACITRRAVGEGEGRAEAGRDKAVWGGSVREEGMEGGREGGREEGVGEEEGRWAETGLLLPMVGNKGCAESPFFFKSV